MSTLDWTGGRALHDIPARAAGLTPEAPALLDGDRRFTFADLTDRIARTAAVVDGLAAPGARIAFVGENHWSWVDAYYGVPRAGRILVFGNHRLAPPELRSVLARSGATVLVGPRSELDRIEPPAAVRRLDLDGWEAALAAADPSAGAALPDVASPRADAWIIYTSGTTGRSKGAVLTHAGVLAAVRATDECRKVAPDDVYLLPFPLAHIAGYNVVHHHAHGVPVVLVPRFDPEGFVTTVARHRVTSASLAATMLHALLDHLDEHPAQLAELATLRLVAYGAAPMPTPLLRRAHAVLGIDFTQGYGMTELSGNAVFLDVAEHRRGLAGDPDLLRTAGRPAPGVEVRVVDEADRPLPAGAAGEIVVRAGQVMDRYWDDPEATATALAGGWLHTGDVGRFDADGRLSVVDRKKDVIVTGGENVSSLEVEQVLHHLPEVGEVAVVGVPDPRWGENVCAVVVPRPGATIDPDALVAAVRAELAGFKTPRHVVVTDALPKNATGKIVKAELRAWLAQHPEELGERVSGRAVPGEARGAAGANHQGVEIVPNPGEHRFEIHVDGAEAGHSEYVRKGDRVIFTHTEIDPAFAGRGLGSRLARGVLDAVRAAGDPIVPLCPFIAGYLAKHPEYDDLVDHECLEYLETRARTRDAR